ncbi:alpha/beta hydrolase [Chitinophaga silvatica]|uniref:Alpha/beta hydrolase n=1 Tax=Chitinophaga silvatica TaxID=2282649 RepID=A0A3E1YC18_9BACT|nr:alpha/beta hydrolase [Chitinophaga silvatica]RFS23549.1 alpha/beta hydrolase [Chitinophaga silvatica]
MKKLVINLLAIFCFFSFVAKAQDIPTQDIYLSNYKYPYPVHYLPLNIQGQHLKMAYMDVQPSKPNGKTIVLLHGKNFNGAYWDKTAADLSNNGYRVVIPDQIGFGKSSKPKCFQYSFQQLAQNTKLLLDSLQIDKAAILGHSMGGMLATRFALMYPNTTEKLILENPIGLEDWKTVVPYQSIDQWYKGELQQSYAKIKQYMMDSYYAGQWTPEYDKWARLQASWINSPDYAIAAWNAALTYDMIFTQPVLYEFGNLKMPTLLIIGQRDRTALGKASVPDSIRSTLGNYPVLGRNAASKIPHATLVPIDNVGHLPHIEAYTKFIAPLLDFLHQ